MARACLQRIDQNGDDWLELEELVSAFECKHHPDYLSGRKSQSQVLHEFLERLGTERVQWNDFLRYYVRVGASVDEETFEMLVRACVPRRNGADSFLRRCCSKS